MSNGPRRATQSTHKDFEQTTDFMLGGVLYDPTCAAAAAADPTRNLLRLIGPAAWNGRRELP